MFFGQVKRIWSAYAAILVLVASVLVWVSWFTIRLDHQAEQSRHNLLVAEQEAAQQERIGRALWRLDWALSPLIAQEAARTHWMYQSFLEQSPSEPSKASKAIQPQNANQPRQPSPLLIRPSPWVLLHFQLTEDSILTSPQAPDGKLREVAVNCGVTPKELSTNCERLEQISGKVKFGQLWDACSTTMLNQSDPSLAWALPPNEVSPNQIASQQAANAQPQSLNDLPQAIAPVDNYSGNARQQENKVSSARGSRSQSIDFQQRGQAPNNIAVGQWQFNRYASAFAPPDEKSVVEGSLKPVWVDQRLLLIRRIESPQGKLVQGCWLDWPAIRSSLLGEIAEIVPDADLLPHVDDNSSRPALATLPVELVAPMISPIQAAEGLGLSRVLPLLAIAWGGFAIAAFSLGWLMWGITQLSERRAAFASAVTHELRTPLTTFRLYSEMLASDMVSDTAQRQAYATGLVRESDRLCRLVENVLQFARLERRQSKIHLQEIKVQQLLAKTVDRCSHRAQAAEMQFEFEIPEAVGDMNVNTSPDLVEQILFNLVDNACKYAIEAQTKRVELSVTAERNWLVVTVRDYGPGIDAKMLKRLFRPFSRSSDETAGTAAGVGLGLSLSRQLAKRLGGELNYLSIQPGCKFEVRLPL